MGTELNRLRTTVDAQHGLVFLSGAAVPLSMSPEVALALADLLTDAAAIARGQEATTKLQRGEEWV